MWVATEDLPRSAAHPFYRRLNQILDQDDFDGYVEGLCQRFYADEVGRPGLAARTLLSTAADRILRRLGCRARHRVACGGFLGAPRVSRAGAARCAAGSFDDFANPAPDRLETHEAVFTWILQRLADAGLVKGKTIGIDATTLEANAALRSIVRRDTGDTYQEFLTQLAQASGIATPTREDLARIDRKRPKKGSNDDWAHPLDPDAKITKMKDGRTHLAHKPRTIDITPSTVQLLKAHRSHQSEIKLKNRPTYHDHELVFAKEWRDLGRKHDVLGEPLQINNLGQREYRRLIKAADVRPIRFHGLRHTCATLMFQAGVPVKVIQERLGHKRIEMTLGIYAHVLPSMQQDAASRLGALLHG